MADGTKTTIDISQAAIFAVVFVALSILVGLGKVPPDKLELILMALVPSPLKSVPSTAQVGSGN